MQMFGQKDRCPGNRLLDFDCEKGCCMEMKRRQAEMEYEHRRDIYRARHVCMCSYACTRQYAVTKASQIGNSFSQFRRNDHRGNVNVSDCSEGCGYSLRASMFAPWEGIGRGWGEAGGDAGCLSQIKSDESQNDCQVLEASPKRTNAETKCSLLPFQAATFLSSKRRSCSLFLI